MSSHNAERSFWKTPELIERLLPFLDSRSTARLAQAHEKTLNILQGCVPWGKLIKRSRSEADNGNSDPSEAVCDGVANLTAILKMMQDPETVLLPNLLDLICERFPAPSCTHNDPGSCDCHGTVSLDCAHHPGGHVVTLLVFCLLEWIEAAFGTAKQAIEAITRQSLMEPVLSALAARLSRQKKKITLLSASSITLDSNKSAEAFNTLVTASHSCLPSTPGAGTILVVGYYPSEGEFGREGWKTLAETLQLCPDMTRRDMTVVTTKSVLDQGSRVDLKKLWDIIGPEGLWRVGSEDYAEVLTGEASWLRLQQIIDMSADAWTAAANAAAEEEEQEQEEEEEGGEPDDGEGEEGDGEEEEGNAAE